MADPATPSTDRPQARTPRGFADRRARDLAPARDPDGRQRGLRALRLRGAGDLGLRICRRARQVPARRRPAQRGRLRPAGRRRAVDGAALRPDRAARPASPPRTGRRLPKPFRRYAFGPVWRNEKPGPGRYREFVQCDADTVGSARPEADAEIIAMAVAGLEAAGLPRGHGGGEDQQPQAAQRPADRRRRRQRRPEAGGAARRRQARPAGPGRRARCCSARAARTRAATSPRARA